MNYFFVVATVTLTFQIVVLVLLIIGFGLKRHLKFRLHGFTMLAALVVHLIVIGAVMVPSFVIGVVPIILEKPTSLIGLSSPFHAVAGTVTAILGGWIVVGWRLRQSLTFCAPKKKFMRATFILWVVTLSLGVLLYFVFNWSFLFG